MEYRTSTPVAAGRATANTTLAAANDVGVNGRRRIGRRSFAADHDNGCGGGDDDNNNSGGVGVGPLITANDTTVLVDELEQLRTDNFQLRLRVYNAERRVDRLSAMRSRDAGSGGDDDSSVDTTASSSSSSSSTSGDDDDDNGRAVAAAKATAEAAVRTIHDLLTVNRRLLALLAATVSAKAVAVTADDKRRWQMLRRRIDHYGDHHQVENEKHVDDDGPDSTTTRILDVVGTGKQSAATTIRRATLSSQPPLEPPVDAAVVAADDVDDDDDNNDCNGDGGAGSELSRLRARCRRLERSLQQLVNTELWARNRQIGKLEQQRYVTQVQQQAATAREERRAATPAAGRGILVRKKSSPETTEDTPPAEASTTITTPPPVLPDYSEVNFFYSCDDEDELDDDDDNDDDDDKENDSETNRTWPSAAAKDRCDETGDDNEKEPVKLSATPRPPSSSSQLVRSRKRQCRRQNRPQVLGMAVTSSAESVSAQRTAAADLLQSDDVTTCPSRLGRRAMAGIAGPNRRWRQRCRPRRRCSTCGRFGDGSDGSGSDHDGSTADAQVQCDGGGGVEDGDEQLVLLRRELEARRRENCRLYEMLLTLQQRRLAKTASASSADSEDHDDDDDAGNDGSPERYRRAARTVRGRIADLLTAAGPETTADTVVAPPSARNANDQQTVQQQQQQLLLLARLRERIVAYERHELFGNDVDRQSASAAADQENAVERMDRAALVNVALPRAVDRLRRALVPLLHHKQQQNKQQSSANEAERPEQSSVG